MIAFPGGTLDSSNSAIYTTCASVAAGGLPIGTLNVYSMTINCPATTKGRYVLIHGTATSPGQALTACEIVVRGTYMGGKCRIIIIISEFASLETVDQLSQIKSNQIKLYLATDIHRHIYMYNHIYIYRLCVNNKCIICTYDIAVAWCCLA